MISILILFGAAALIGYAHFTQDLPSLDALKDFRPPTVTYFYSDDGRVLGEFSYEYRIVIPLSKMPSHVINAFIAAEDTNFFHHEGLDYAGILRAVIVNLKAGRIVQGASTITQQVTRSFLLTNERTLDRKIREALLAYRLEQNLTKEEILFLYLNQIYLGQGAYGVEGAAQIYFGEACRPVDHCRSRFHCRDDQGSGSLFAFSQPQGGSDQATACHKPNV